MANTNGSFIVNFFKQESSGGLLLMFSALLAIIFANTALSPYYELLLTTPVEVRVGALEIAKPLLLWINDGLMAVFFFLVGLELKRELVEGELSDPRNIILPGIGAVGGMAVPALFYTYFNAGNPVAMQGWAIPAATDIAFALGVLSLLGSRVPVSLKIFLTSLAIFDDIGAIVIIAVFYTANISIAALVIAASCIPALIVLNRRGVSANSPYILLGTIMWVALLKSGVHATLAGVVMAMFIPLRSNDPDNPSPLKSLEHDLHSVVAFFVLPVFAFANAAINLSGVGVEQLMHGVPMGIAAGLFLGKQIGIFGLCYLAIKLRLAEMPSGMNTMSLYGTAALCGIGFTMSLFIGGLAFIDPDQIDAVKMGVLVGSLISAVIGMTVLATAPRAATRPLNEVPSA